MTDSVTAIVDSPDGSFEVAPDTRVSRRQRRWAVTTAAASLALGLALVAYTTIYAPGGPQILAIVLFVMIVAFGALGWMTTGTPKLKADAEEVSYLTPFRDQRMPRSELTSIVRGEIFFQGRRSVWLQSYLFTDRSGKFVIRVLASWYAADGMAAFAARLGVPLRGDFSDRYRGAG
jgi:hypothetical protein